jgi:glycerophosphoryl diester phosphodiesterase
LIAALGDRANVVVSSFDWEQLSVLRRAAPRIALAPLSSRPPVEEVLAVADRLAAFSIHVHALCVAPALLDAARAAGRPVLAYTVNDAGDARALFAAGVSGVFTDDPARLMRELAITC